MAIIATIIHECNKMLCLEYSILRDSSSSFSSYNHSFFFYHSTMFSRFQEPWYKCFIWSWSLKSHIFSALWPVINLLHWNAIYSTILISLNIKNPKSGTKGVKAERSQKWSSQSLVLTSIKSSDQVGYYISSSPQTKCPELLTPFPLYSSLRPISNISFAEYLY